MTRNDDRQWLDKFHLLRTDAVDAVIRILGPQTITAESRPLSEHPAIYLRDSLTYRAESVGYHIDLLKWHLVQFTADAHRSPGSDARDDLMRNATKILTLLSDDVLFNATSMLDYVGNLVGFAHGGQNCQRLKWNGAAKSALDKNNRLSRTAAGAKIVELHRDWVDRLHGIRSMLIHERNAVGDAGYTLTVEDQQLRVTLSFALPRLIVNRLRFLNSLRDSKGVVNLVAGTEQVGLRALDAASAVISALLADFGGRLVAADGRPQTEQS